MEQGFDRLPAILPTPVGVFSFTCMDSIPELEAGRSSWWPTSIRPRPLPRLTARS